MGGGYYDRYLASLSSDVQVIGVAFACQASETHLPREPWDHALDMVVNENGIEEFN